MKKLLSGLFLLLPFLLIAQSESEPNNDFEQANTISFDQPVNGAISTVGDRDYFRVEISEPGVLIARLKNIPAGRTYEVTIYNADQQELTDDFGSDTDPAYADRLRCTPGVYYISVNENGDNNSSPDLYELTVSFDVSDAYERDYYQVNIPSSGTLTAIFRIIPRPR